MPLASARWSNKETSEPNAPHEVVFSEKNNNTPTSTIAISAEIVRQWADGNEVCTITILKLKTPAGGNLQMGIAEWIVVEGGKIKTHTIYYDPRGFAEAFPL